MSHFGPHKETHEVTGWTADELRIWIANRPRWAGATLMATDCQVCGPTIELVMDRVRGDKS